MSTSDSFRFIRRQQFLTLQMHQAMQAFSASELERCEQNLTHGSLEPDAVSTNARLIANIKLEQLFRLYTAGEDLHNWRWGLDAAVASQERSMVAFKQSTSFTELEYPFWGDTTLADAYVDYLGLVSSAILVHREDLLPRIHALIEGEWIDGNDAVIEELLSPFLPDRPSPDEWMFDKPYRLLLDALDEPTPAARSQGMKKYVQGWYKGLKGKALFWGAHEKVDPDGLTAYRGYWCLGAAALTYLYDLDDSSYRDEIVYPKDLVDFARSMPRRTVQEATSEASTQLRVEAGRPCPKAGFWFTPARPESRRRFELNEPMPDVGGDYGLTIWQWDPRQ